MKIRYEENIYVIADLHVGPNNRRTLGVRGYGADWISHMQHVISSINETCKKQDTLYILGDIGFKDATKDLEDFIKSLKCRVKVCDGNHDSIKQLKKLHEKGIIQDFKHEYDLEYHGYYIHLAHFPKAEWKHFFEDAFHAFGHCHGNYKPKFRSYDVGVDNIGYHPINLLELINILKDKHNVDEHKNRLES